MSEAVAFGVPDAIYGEQVQAAVVLKPGSTLVKEALLQHCRQKLAPFKCPQEIYIATDLPRTATGKIQRRIVAAHFTSNKHRL